MRKVLILSSLGGYGHSAAAHTLMHLLQGQWRCTVFHPINELKICGLRSGEALYNFLISRNYTHLMNWMASSVAPYLFHRRTEKTVRLIQEQLELEKPDLLISLIPYVNYPASEAARRYGIPFLIVTTDNDLCNWVYGLEKMTHPHAKITIGCDLPSSRGLLEKRSVSGSSIETIGLPLRPSFHASLDKKQLRKTHGISEDSLVVLIMMGGAGASSAFDYAQKLSSLSQPVHIVVCTGRNQGLADRLSLLKQERKSSIEIIPFTEQVQEWMAICDLLITKPGPGTINEAMELKLPLLLDRTSTPLYWEEVNLHLVEKWGIGQVLHTIDDLEKSVMDLLSVSSRRRIAEVYAGLPQNQFHQRLPKLVEELVSGFVDQGETMTALSGSCARTSNP